MGKWKKVVYKQIQPINLGYKKHGVINETRAFITGQSMWGALTNAYGQKEKWAKNDYDNTENQKIFENITCFYPMIKGAILYPRYENGESYLGYCSEKEFRKDFTTTYLSTSINPTTLNAKDKSLHEIDVILPKDIYWVGYLKIDDIEKIPDEIYIGSDSRYGLGKMKLDKNLTKEDNYSYEVVKGVYKEYPKNEPLSNFLEFKPDIEFEGEIELLAQFNFSGVTPTVDEAKFYITPGSTISQ